MNAIHNLIRGFRLRRLEAKLARLVAESETFASHIGADDEVLQVERFQQLAAEIRSTRSELDELRGHGSR